MYKKSNADELISDSPKPAPDTSSKNVEEGKSASITCPIPYKKTDLLRWFKV